MRRYLRTWFIFDIIATLPYTWFIKDRDVDYWPDDDFDELEGLNKGLVGTMHSYLQTDKLVSTLGDFDLAQTMRLLKLTRCVRVIKLNQVFKLRKLVYRVRIKAH